MPKEERPAAGKTINECKAWAEARYQQLNAEIERIELEARNRAEAVDITLPGTRREMGNLHPHHAGQKTRSWTLLCRHGL